MKLPSLAVLAVFVIAPVFAQTQSVPIELSGHQELLIDKCGYDEQLAAQQLVQLGDHWGYGYDSLLVDLERWRQSPYVTIDSIGASVQNRALWQLNITSDTPEMEPRRTVFVHARTHPNEVQAWWVTDELISLLLSEEPFARFMRESCTFYIIPMYNPDGVELEFARQNANGIDIESNWDKNPVQPEVAVLRNRFGELMASDAPIETALNMHSAFACKRYFVYHDAVGTSPEFTVLEQDFIGFIRSYFEDGIEPWSYFVSWTSGTPTRYPESWFWLNHGEDVMALTYEDMNCTAAGQYDQTAFAVLHGVADYLGLVVTAVLDRPTAQIQGFSLRQNYPNPVRLSRTTSMSSVIQFRLEREQPIRLVLYDVLGRQVKVLDQGRRPAAEHRVYFDASNLATGTYFYQLQTAGGVVARQLTVTR